MLTAFRACTLAVLTLVPASAVLAQEALPGLPEMLVKPEVSAIFDKMSEGWEVPAWVRHDAVSSPGQKVSFGGREYSAFWACQNNDCGNNQISVIYNEADKQMFGLIVRSDSENGPQTLNWMGLGGGDETIDGKTILYAAVTGSLANHPTSFNFQK